VRYQRPLFAHLLKKYEYQYQHRHQYESEDKEYEHRTGKSLKKREYSSLALPFLHALLEFRYEPITYRQQLPGVRMSKA
jgi:hypothetical protein